MNKPEKETVRITFDLPKHQHKELTHIASERGVTLKQLILESLPTKGNNQGFFKKLSDLFK